MRNTKECSCRIDRAKCISEQKDLPQQSVSSKRNEIYHLKIPFR